jgi:hypothetical protein
MLNSIGIKDPLVLKTYRQKKSRQGNSFWSKGCKRIFIPAEWTLEHKMVNSGFSVYPWHSCTCPLSGICPGQRFTIFLDWLKGLGDRWGHIIWQAIFAGNGAVQESRRRNRYLLNSASDLRWWPEEF